MLAFLNQIGLYFSNGNKNILESVSRGSKYNIYNLIQKINFEKNERLFFVLVALT